MTTRMGVREFRDNFTVLAREAAGPVIVTNHDEAVGWFTPARRSPRSIEEVLAELKSIRRAVVARGVDIDARLKALGIEDGEGDGQASKPLGRGKAARRKRCGESDYPGREYSGRSRDRSADAEASYRRPPSGSRPRRGGGPVFESCARAHRQARSRGAGSCARPWRIGDLVFLLAPEFYAAEEETARERFHERGQSDWMVLAAALASEGGVCSNDRDFFGVGLPVWSSRNIGYAS